VEQFFSGLKTKLRNARPRPHTRLQLKNLLGSLMDQMIGHTAGYFREMRRWLAQAAAGQKFTD